MEEIDEKLYSTIYWFIDANMTADSLESIVVLMRRFLLVGKIGSAIQFLNVVSLPKLINDYRYSTSMLPESETDGLVAKYKLKELTQYHNLFSTFKLLLAYDPMDNSDESLDKLDAVLKSADKLVKSWLFDLVNDADETNEYTEDLEIYKELRRIYIPTIFNQYFDILMSNQHRGKKYAQRGVDLVNVLADEEFKLYEIFMSTNDLEPFMKKFADVSCSLYGEYKEGVYV